jgi:hypothetical protein
MIFGGMALPGSRHRTRGGHDICMVVVLSGVMVESTEGMAMSMP